MRSKNIHQNKMTETMTASPFNPENIEEVVMKCIYALSKKGEESVDLSDVVVALKEKESQDVTEELVDKVARRLTMEGLLTQDIPGTVIMLPCGELNFEDDYS